ncbi:high-affinity choline transporter 1-like protein [Lates japonicus]|uniref:High-affinity choline transporter 1-like protein n=1 Tax=Lates japonicus TaxID=270547 RepID=A0AAD3N8A1_LATJO|nr:high-affinity choline transporter 1-like protein [Lates japonicus]
MALNVPGLVVTIIFYLLVLGVGIWASFKSKKDENRTQANHADMALLGDRKISLVVGIFTTTATWVGGTFIIGTAETVYDPKLGLTWAVMPLAATLAFTLGVTMSVILDLSYAVSIWISAAVAITYTLLGGLYSVAYTDIIQLSLIFITSWLCVPFVLMSPASVDITTTSFNHTFQAPWVGTLTADRVGRWIDIFLLLTESDLCMVLLHMNEVRQELIFTLSCTTLTPPYISVNNGIELWPPPAMSSTDSALLSAASIFSSNIYKKN